ncbi:FAD dependent oxidoreductase [Auricularia subglabra TFB-10046 SS5]|nr:FAD dependent oxidoreductase [Auricularia subglabra TFB-10046 SS5]
MVRGLRAALNASGRYKFVAPEQAVDHVIVGGGVVGLAIGARLSRLYTDKSTVVLERHSSAGQEISSRNSEVIHAGIYYPADSLKTRLCLRGRALLKQHCETHNVPHAFSGKLVVGTREQQQYLRNLHEHAQRLPAAFQPRTRLITGDDARALQPDLAPSIVAALHSLDTGIVDSHSLMQSLEAQIQDSETGDLAYRSRVVRVDPDDKSSGWVVQVDGGDAILARTLINASGLSANLILNSLARRPEDRIPLYFARGSYASYRGPGVKDVSMLIYPVPVAKSAGDAHSFQGLGTHLTLDLAGNVRFGPDLEWLDIPAEQAAGEFSEREEDIDFWAAYHKPEESPDKLKAIHEAVCTYLPGISLDGLQIDYAGIRPKTAPPGAPFQDFRLRVDYSSGQKGYGAKMVTLLGIESPGLTSALAIAEHVDELVYPKATKEGKDANGH